MCGNCGSFEFYAFRVDAAGRWSRLPQSVWAATKPEAEFLARFTFKERLVLQSRASYEAELRERTHGDNQED